MGAKCISITDLGGTLIVLAVLAVNTTAAKSAARHPVVIVGPGVTSCIKFLNDAKHNFDRELRYFAWVQGYMSGILMRAPPGKDERLNLLPRQFPIAAQIGFLRNYCANHPDTNYEDAVAILYRKLRTFSPNGTEQNK